MQTTLNSALESYLRSKTLSRGTRNEYRSTLKKWEQWGAGLAIEELRRKDIREFLAWVYERAVADKGTNPGRTANKAREHLRAILSWAWEQEVIETPPRFPKPREQRDVAGRHYLTKAEINSLYFATHKNEPVHEDGAAPSPLGGTGDARWLSFSTTASIRVRFGNQRRSTNLSAGATFIGIGNRRTAK
jgi:site-specific recombinase XerD